MKKHGASLGVRGALILRHGVGRIFIPAFETAKCEKLRTDGSAEGGFVEQRIGVSSYGLLKNAAWPVETEFPHFTGRGWPIFGLSSLRRKMQYSGRGTRNLRHKFGPISVDEKTSNVSLEGGSKYSVIKIDNTGSCESMLLTVSELGIHPRDMDLLVGNFFIPKRSTIAIRKEKVLMRMENVRALVYKDNCFLFDAHHPRKGLHKLNLPPKMHVSRQEALQRAREAFALSMAEYAKENPCSLQEPMPFHLRMIECMLEETCNFFHQKVERLKVVVEKVLEDLTNDVDMGGLQRLLPLKRVLTEVEHDICDTHEAIEQVLGSDDALTALCFEHLENSTTHSGTGSQPSSEQDQDRDKLRRAAADIILTYQRQVDDAGGVVEELRKGIESAQEVWELTLDTTRNKIIRMNLFISMATLSFSLATLPASFFGMNLISGLEASPNVFYIVIGATSASAGFVGLGLVLMFRKFIHKRRAQDLAALQDLLNHIDDIDDIFQVLTSKGGAMTQDEFRKVLRSHPSTESMQEREIDLIFRVFDHNRNGQLEAREWNAVAQRRSKGRTAAQANGMSVF